MPDMTPQGLADAINDLVEDLPRRERPPNESWQKILALQALEQALNWHTPAGRILGAALEAALVDVLRDTQALRGALRAAFPSVDYHLYQGVDDDPAQTAFARSNFGRFLDAALARAINLEGSAAYRSRAGEDGDDAGAD